MQGEITKIESRLRTMATDVDSNPQGALIDLRAIYCVLQRSNYPLKDEVIYWMARAYLKLSDYEKAKRLVQGWLKKGPDNPYWHLRLLIVYAATLQIMGFLFEALRTYESAIEMAQVSDDQDALHSIYNNSIELCNAMGAYEDAQGFYFKLLPLISGQVPDLARTSISNSITLGHLGQIEKALEALKFANDYYEGEGDYRRIGLVLESRGTIATLMGDYQIAIQFLLKSRHLLEAYGEGRDLCRVTTSLGHAYFTLDAFTLALEAFEEGIYYALQNQLPLLIDKSYYYLALCREALGDAKGAMEGMALHIAHIKKIEALKNLQNQQVLSFLLERHRLKQEIDQASELQIKLHQLHDQIEDQNQSLRQVALRYESLRGLASLLTKQKTRHLMIDAAAKQMFVLFRFDRAYYVHEDPEDHYLIIQAITGQGIGHDFVDVPCNQCEDISSTLRQCSGMQHLLWQTLDYRKAKHLGVKESHWGIGILRAGSDAFDGYEEALFHGFMALLAGTLRLVSQLAAIEQQQLEHNRLLRLTKEKYRQLQGLSYYDELTGLYNRVGLAYCIDQALLSTPLPTEMVAVVLDLDHFKTYNDTFGHIIGDRLLKTFSDLLQSAFSAPQYLLSRFGGEEFLLLASSRYASDIYEHCKQLLVAVRQLHHKDQQLQQGVTISIGMSRAYIQESRGLFELIDQADQQLYRAKRKGRDCICWNEGEGHAYNR